MGYVHTNSRGQTYYLNKKMVVLRNSGGKSRPSYYFSKDEREEHCDLPDTHEVSESQRSGLPFLRRKK